MTERTMKSTSSSGYESGTDSTGGLTLDGAADVFSRIKVTPGVKSRFLSFSYNNLNDSTVSGLQSQPPSVRGRGPRRTTSWSHVTRPPLSRDYTSSSGWTSRMTTATSRGCRMTPSTPRIPWGQFPGFGGTRTGTISPIDSEGAQSPTKMLPVGHDYLKRAKLVCKVLLKEAAAANRTFRMCFQSVPIEAPNNVDDIRPRLGSSDVFDVAICLKAPVPGHAFEVVSSLPRDVPPGHGVARLNPKLSAAEKVGLRRSWGPLLAADEYLTPSLVNQCISDAVRRAVNGLTNVTIGEDLYGFLITSNPPETTVVVSFVNMDSTSEEMNSSFTLKLFPLIVAAGPPRISGFHLRMPVPHVLPYSRVGHEIMRVFEGELKDWTLFWTLEARYVKQKSNSSLCGADFKVKAVTKRAKLRQEEREAERAGSLPQKEHLKSWVISFEPLEKRLLELCLKHEFFAKAAEAFGLFDNMVSHFGEEWSIFPPSLTTSLKLWTIFRTAWKNKRIIDWLLALLVTFHECLKERFCAYFLMPRINMLCDMDEELIDNLAKELQSVLQGTTVSKPTYTLSRHGTSVDLLQRRSEVGLGRL